MTVAFEVRFSEHMPQDRVTGMITILQERGTVLVAADGRSLSLEGYRPAKIESVKNFLTLWLSKGFIQPPNL